MTQNNKRRKRSDVFQAKHQQSNLKRFTTKTFQCVVIVLILNWGLSFLLSAFVRSDLFDELFVAMGKAFAKHLPVEFDPVVEKGYDYTDVAHSWVAHPDVADWADMTPPESDIEDEQHNATASVFYVYPSGYFGLRLNSPVNPHFWSDPLGVVGDFLADVTGGMVHGSVFNGAGKIFTPRYRQMTGWAFLLPPEDPRRKLALALALEDIEKAFEHFIRVNHQRPFILASHSQGSMILCKMLKQRYSRKDVRHELDHFVVAYLVAADLSDGDCGEVVRQCHQPLDLKCFIHYNVFVDDGDRSKFLLATEDKNLSCVNPLSFRADDTIMEHTLNPGSRPIFRPWQILKAWFNKVTRHKTPNEKQSRAILNMMSPLEKGIAGARCHKGVVWTTVKDITTGFWTTGMFPGGNMHGGESSLYYMSTRLNAKARVNEHLKQKQAE